MGIVAAVGTAIGSLSAAIGGTAIAGSIAAATGISAATIGTLATGALVGGGIGAATSAISGGNPLTGALTGAVGGGLIGGFGGALAGSLGTSVPVADALIGAGVDAGSAAITGGNPLTAGLMGGIGGYAGGALSDSGSVAAGQADLVNPDGSYVVPPAAQVASGSSVVDPVSGAILSPGDAGYSTAVEALNNPVAGASSNVASGDAATSSGSGGAAASKGGISGTALALGALAGVGALLSKPQQAAYGSTPGPAQVAANTGALYNTGLNTNVPGRTAVNPFSTTVNPTSPGANAYGTYGGPEKTYFTGNSLTNFGFAKGGAMSREFTTQNGRRHVEGPGTGVSDSIPAKLSDGEYVLTAKEVSGIGRGSNDGGARKLDRLRKTGALAQLLSRAA